MSEATSKKTTEQGSAEVAIVEKNEKAAGGQRNLTDFFKIKKVHSQPSLSGSSQQSGLKRSRSARSELDLLVDRDWLETPIPKRKYKEKITCHRETPRVKNMAYIQAVFDQPEPVVEPIRSRSYRARVAEACGHSPNDSIFTFKEAAPKSVATKALHVVKHKEPLERRKISPNPMKCLDAPYMIDDYYLNIMDWSSKDLFTVGLDKSVYLWNTNNGNIQALDYDLDITVTSLAFSDDGNFLAVGIDNGATQIWDVKSNTKIRSMVGKGGRVCALSWNKKTVSAGHQDGSIITHDVSAAKHVIRELHGHEDQVCGLKWRTDGERLASGSNDNIVNVWDTRNNKPIFTINAHMGAVKALAWCPWSKDILATGGGRDDKRIIFWNITKRTRLDTIATGSQVTSLRWSLHYKEIASTHGSPNNNIAIWEYPSMTRVADFPAHDSRILHSVLSPDGEVLATAAADDTVKFFDIFRNKNKNSHSSRKPENTFRKVMTLR